MDQPVAFRLASTSKVLFNELYDTMPTESLRADLVAIQLVTGKWIDVSWFPQFDPNGEYHVTVFPDSTFEQLIAATTAKTPSEVVEAVDEYDAIYG